MEEYDSFTLPYAVSITTADGLATQGTNAPVAMLLIWFSGSIPVILYSIGKTMTHLPYPSYLTIVNNKNADGLATQGAKACVAIVLIEFAGIFQTCHANTKLIISYTPVPPFTKQLVDDPELSS